MRSSSAAAGLLAGLTGLAALVLLGCGGDGGSTPPDQFQAEANQVCKDAQQQFDKILRASPRTADQAEKQAAALADVSQQALDNLRDISPPDQVKDAYSRYLDARDAAIGYIDDAKNAAADHDGTAYARAKRKTATTQPRRRQLALASGLKSCSVPNVSLGKPTKH
jgi:hypothetical protein